MKKIPFYLFTFALFLFISSCTKDNEQELYGDNCDTKNISYNDRVSAIFKANCTSCHGGNSPSAGIKLDSYLGVKEQIDNKRLLGAIKHEPNFSEMPQGGTKLPECQIKQIEAWINDGAKNN